MSKQGEDETTHDGVVSVAVHDRVDHFCRQVETDCRNKMDAASARYALAAIEVAAQVVSHSKMARRPQRKLEPAAPGSVHAQILSPVRLVLAAAAQDIEGQHGCLRQWQERLRTMLDDASAVGEAEKLWHNTVVALEAPAATASAAGRLSRQALCDVVARGAEEARDGMSEATSASSPPVTGTCQVFVHWARNAWEKRGSSDEDYQFRFSTPELLAATRDLLGEQDWAQWPRFRRIERLTRWLEDARKSSAANVKNHQRQRALRADDLCVGPQIVVRCSDLDDVLGAWAVALYRRDMFPNGVHIAPLCAGIEELERAGATVAALLEHALYRSHVAHMADVQHVMLDPVESLATEGVFATAWALQQAQRTLSAVGEAFGVAVNISFGGQRLGGMLPIGSAAGVLSTPPGCSKAFVGFDVSRAFVKHHLCSPQHAAAGLGQLLMAQIMPQSQATPTPSSFFEAMAVAAGASKLAWRVLERRPLKAWLEQSSAWDAITMLDTERPTLSSHCAAEQLAAWAQSRLLLPGWYGISEGLLAAEQQYGLSHLQSMYRQWPFFEHLLDRTAQVLALVDFEVAAQYAPPHLSPDIVALVADVQAAHAHSSQWVSRVRGMSVESSPASFVRGAGVLRAGHHHHVQLLAQWREAGAPRDGTLAKTLLQLSCQLEDTIESLLVLA